MRPLIILFLLICASCRSHRETSTDSSTACHVERLNDTTRLDISQLLTLVKNDATLHVAGISIEFCPRDSASPETQPRPKAIRIDSLDLRRSSQSTSLDSHFSAGTASESSKEDSAAENHSRKNTSLRALTFPPWHVVAVIITLALIILYLRRRHRQ